MEGDPLLLVSGQLPAILRAIMVIWYVIGFGLAGMGLMRMIQAGNHRGAASHGWGGAIGMLVCGALMLNLIGTVSSAFATVYGIGASPEYVLSAVDPEQDRLKAWVAVFMNVLVVIGWYAGGRGLYKMATAKSHQGNGVGSGIVHLVASVALCNPQLFAHMLGASLGAAGTVSLIIPSPSP